VDVVPIFDGIRQANLRRVEIDDDGLWLCESRDDEESDEYSERDWQDISDQLSYGDFSPGRFAWLLSNITPIDPVPVKGHQGLWNWEGK
jgi:hypothetical protein